MQPQSQSLARTQRETSFALLWLLAFVLLALHLGGAPLFDVDEGAFSEATREMLESGDLLSTTLNGRPRFDKPILIYWLQTGSVALFGLNEFALRLPSVLAASLWCALLGRFATLQVTGAAGLVATLVAVSSLGVFIVGRASTADALLNLLLAATLFDGWQWYQSRRRVVLLRTYLWMALGLLTKGPIALVLPALISFIFFASVGALRDWLRFITNAWGWAVLLVVAAPWYAAALSIHGWNFVDGFLLHHNVQRFTSTLEGHAGTFVYYLITAPLLLLPWTGAVWNVAARLRADLRAPLPRLLWIWFGVVLVFFSLSATKLPHYALYGLTPLLVLIAAQCERVPGRLIAVTGVLWFVLLGLLPSIIEWTVQAGFVHHPYYAAMLDHARAQAGATYPILVAALGLSALVVALRNSLRVEIRWLMLGVASNLALAFAVVPWIGEVLQGPIKRAGVLARELHEPTVTWNFDAPSFSVYRGAVTESRAPRSGELALVRVDRLPSEAAVDVVFAERGVLLVRQR